MISRRRASRGVAVLLATVTALPAVGTGTAAAAAPRSARTVKSTPVPSIPRTEPELVPGEAPAPGQQWQIDTPDQVLAPTVYTPTPREDSIEPGKASEGAYDLIEYVPLSDAVGKVPCSKQTGPYQRQVERWLKLKADGRQSAADCRAIRAFQLTYGIKPAIGFAGPVTWSTMMLVSARKDPNADGKCPVRSYRVACVDLNRQLTWVQQGSEVEFGPVPMRSGRKGHVTRKGWHTVYWRHKNHVSTLYNQPMPYAQFFDGGEAFHAVYGSIYTTVGSWGCVNLKLGDARTLWGVLRKGDHVYVWGRRPGT
ncbi:L,D-transpeptidase family protein [Streptomyces sp. MMG1121]|uniref:L,D-transpeptidase family protein n=1 Tax=Streptomyces sp. MMG1121 TaxID=1415544 RepID=UPI0006AFB6F8|nr:L,D-transpeptidase [Streptomyces sp. MMG1121]KOV59455.1 Tat pathway signal protein [Streptomyces sp. MMG1121]